MAEQLSRLAGIERDVVVEAVPGDDHGLFWRTRMQYVHLPDGGVGLRKHRSHEVVEVETCLIAHPDAREPDRSDPVVEQVETTAGTHEFTVAGDGFWQVHPGAPRVLVETVLRAAGTAGRGSRRSTSTPGSACSRRSWPRRWVRTGP